MRVLNSAVSAYYYLRVVSHMYLAEPEDSSSIVPTPMLASALAITVLGVLIVGLVPTLLMDAAQRAVSAL